MLQEHHTFLSLDDDIGSMWQERHFDNIKHDHVILEIEKDRQKAEATINVSRGRVYADSEDENMYAAIDSLVDKLDRQIKKHKEKLKDHHRGEGLKNQEAV